MDPVSIIEDTEQTWFCPQMDRQTDRQSETSIPTSISLSRGYNYTLFVQSVNTLSSNPSQIQIMNLVAAVPTDALTTNRAWLLAYTRITTKLKYFQIIVTKCELEYIAPDQT